ncbi:hypothetical protein F442_03598 [Phytophthora nicotianae P10297]|uniref:Uncharacterized protein n=3 Tax=Phytophthora nicotianae TaxID=4792 RepID=V9FSR5_PHYNI|nr:hypothetical protein F443_03618 [Phytophthora nicotianae P1569]ETK93263.1 hypothetical protein L915_03512 [Phytophthora nicotianae]ETP51216.1 hypothetical protein F442_03598 [Phytophthora nicotianae P10297]ETL46707.1 hypothetical protein L916_03462 [Phytophthora nicotianae]ETL99815.1 hypothetical protein L917_03383 [Phytophthora nicotianae]
MVQEATAASRQLHWSIEWGLVMIDAHNNDLEASKPKLFRVIALR